MEIDLCPESCAMTVGALTNRIDAVDKSLTELHSRVRESAGRIDTLALHTEDHRNRMLLLETEHRLCRDKQSDVSRKVELLEDKLEDLRSNVKKIVEGQLDILNSNAATREQFASVLTQKDAQHTKRMKSLRTLIYIGGGIVILATQIYARWDGHDTMLDVLVDLLMGGPKQ